MATLAVACRTSARAVTKQLRNYGARRALHAGQASLAAQNFTMPALSPTMTEGNIATWKIKEGDSFAAGDVLLEIETDKAQMDVEAQEDGILAKIIVGDGAKAIRVGARIAVTAESGDDVSSLEMPAEVSPAPKEAEAPKEQPKEEPKQNTQSAPKQDKKVSRGNASKQKYPLYPSVQHLLQVNGLAKEEADKIPATGPNGRLLKGDVLAYVGAISDSYPSQLADRFKVLSHLDLSNIKVAAKKDAPKKASDATKTAAVVEPADVEVALPVSLTAILAWQKRAETETGVRHPLSYFVALAANVANENLPRSKTVKPSADELFNAVLGLDKAAGKKLSRGSFVPQQSALPRTARQPDVLDILAGKPSAVPNKVQRPVNVFRVSVPRGDEKRGQVFLERFKSFLEAGADDKWLAQRRI